MFFCQTFLELLLNSRPLTNITFITKNFWKVLSNCMSTGVKNKIQFLKLLWNLSGRQFQKFFILSSFSKFEQHKFCKYNSCKYIQLKEIFFENKLNINIVSVPYWFEKVLSSKNLIYDHVNRIYWKKRTPKP